MTKSIETSSLLHESEEVCRQVQELLHDPILQRIYWKWIENGRAVIDEGISEITESEVMVHAIETALMKGSEILRTQGRSEEADTAEAIATSILSNALLQAYRVKEGKYLQTHDRNGNEIEKRELEEVGELSG